MVFLVLLPFLLLALVPPYLLHANSQKMDEPVVDFSCQIWREWFSLLLVNGLVLGIMGVALDVATRDPLPQRQNVFVYVLLATLPLACAFVVNRLHYTYWRHDRQAHLIIDKQRQRAEYSNNGVSTDFALTDVIRIISVSARNGRAPWGQHSYQLFELDNGVEILITCLFYTFTSPAQFFPSAQLETVKRRICWLPKTRLINSHP